MLGGVAIRPPPFFEPVQGKGPDRRRRHGMIIEIPKDDLPVEAGRVKGKEQ